MTDFTAKICGVQKDHYRTRVRPGNRLVEVAVADTADSTHINYMLSDLSFGFKKRRNALEDK